MDSAAPSYRENVVAEGVPARSPGGLEVDFSAEKAVRGVGFKGFSPSWGWVAGILCAHL